MSSAQTGGDLAADKSKRYDRGIRIWGAQGQETLESARVCLITASPTGAEAVKNLVLGGIHSFTLIDNAKVTSPDFGNNFLISPGSLGQSRAQCVTECLKELNETVAGSFIEDTTQNLMAANPKFFQAFSLVIASQVTESDALLLERMCAEGNVPLILCRSYGLVGSLRICVAEHPVVESKPDSVVDDLRLADPWSELSQYVDAIDLHSLDDQSHSHLPYAIILIKAAQCWLAEHDGLPTSATERSSFKSLIKSWQRYVDGFPLFEENFDEAVMNAHRVWAPPTLTTELLEILQDPKASSLTGRSPDFWVLVAALNQFMQSEGAGLPPVDGTLPDMHSSTQCYLDLQKIYKEKAEKDALLVEQYVRPILQSIGRDPDSIEASEVRRFCRNARHLRIVRPRPLSREVSSSCCADALKSALNNEETAVNAGFYVLLRAVDKFHSNHQRFPGVYTDELEEDIALLKVAVNATLSECGVSGSSAVIDDLVTEMCRFAGGELHVVASLVGAMASQESIKLLTRQFVPIGATVIWNAVHCTSSVFHF